MIDEVLDCLNQAHFLGLIVDDRQEDHAETFLHGSVLVELIEHDLGFGAALQFDDNAHAVAIAFIANIRNVFDDLVVDQRSDALDEPGFVDLVRNFGDDDGFAVFVELFDASFGAHHKAATSAAVGFVDSGFAVNYSSAREVRAFDDLQNFRQLRVVIVDERDSGINDLSQIMRWDVGRQANGNSVRTIDQQIRYACGKNVGLDFVAVVVGTEIDGLFI